MTQKLKTGLAFIAALGALLVAGAPASASAPTPQVVERVTVAMTTSHIDMAVANAHGYKVVQINGVLQSVKVSDKPIVQERVEQADGDVTVQGGNPVVVGDCGVSFLYYASYSGRKAFVHTGFDVYRSVLGGSWTVAAIDSAGAGRKTWAILGNSGSWDRTWDTAHSVTGYSWAEVVEGSVLLSDGRVCVSGRPWQDAILFN